jgi:ribosomal-protein-alanine N-acetyltransferase
LKRFRVAEGWRVETERLDLRPFEAGDVDWYAAIRAKPEVVRFLPGGEPTAARARPIAEATVPHFVGLWREVGYGPWAVVERESGRPLGHAGVRFLPELGETEILYMLDTPAWGRGYATEAARAARDFGFEQLKLQRLIAFAVPENTASIHVLEKLGMTGEGVFPAFGLEVVRYGVANPAAP